MTKEPSAVPFLNDIFSSYDLGCVCSLIVVGYKLLQIDRTHGTKALFLFENSAEIIETAQKYWRGELQVDALTYFNALRSIKNQLYSN